MAGGHGGRREGAGRPAKGDTRPRIGRPPKPRTPEEKNRAFDQKAQDILPELFETLKEIAKGYKVAVYEKPRSQRVKTKQMFDEIGDPIYVYSVPPDPNVARYLVDRAAGKAATKSAEQTETELILEVSLTDPEEEA